MATAAEWVVKLHMGEVQAVRTADASLAAAGLPTYTKVCQQVRDYEHLLEHDTLDQVETLADLIDYPPRPIISDRAVAIAMLTVFIVVGLLIANGVVAL